MVRLDWSVYRHRNFAVAFFPAPKPAEVFASDTRWTVVRGSDLEEGENQGLPVWSRHVGDPILQSNCARRVDYALFVVEAIRNDEIIHEAPAIVGCQTPSALAHTTGD